MLSYVAPILGALMLLIVIINVLKGLVRGFKKSLGSLAAIIASVLVSAIVTFIVCNPNSGAIAWVEEGLKGLISMDSLGDIFAVDAIEVALTYYIAMLLAPIFFMLCYILLSLIFGIVFGIVFKRLPFLKSPKKVLHRLGGVGIGLVCGILVCLIAFAPFVGIFSMANNAILALDNKGEIKESLGGGDMNLSAFEATGFLLVYDALSNANLEGERIYLRSEVDTLLGLVGSLGAMGGDLTQMDENQIASLRSLVASIDSSPILRNTVAGIFSTAAEKWTNGEEFLGMAGFDGGELMSDLLNEMLVVLKTTNKDCVTDDLNTMVDIFEVIVVSGIAGDADAQEMLKKLGDGVIADLLVATNKNSRMSPVADEITKLSLKALTSALGSPADADARYNALMDDIADALNDSYAHSEEERFAAVRENLEKDFDHYGVEIEGLALDHVVEGIIYDLGAAPMVAGEDVKEFFIVYELGANDEGGEMKVGGGLVVLGATDGLVINPDGTVSVGGVALKNYNADSIYASKAYSMGKDGVDIGNAETLTDSAHMISTMITLEEFLSHIKHYADCTDARVESEKVGEVFAEISRVFGDSELKSDKASSMMIKMGGIFDSMKATEVFGTDSAELFLKMLFQSDIIKDVMGMSHSELNGFADKINDFAAHKEGGYAEATKAVAGTIEAIEKASDINATREEKKQASESMMQEINHDNKEMITSMVTGNMVNDFGVGIDNTDTVADSFKSLIDNMAKYKDEERSDEDMSSEAQAVSKILTLATCGAGEGPMFDKDGVEGSVDSSSDEFIKSVVESEVVMATVSQTVEGKEQGSNPYGITYADEQEKAEVADSLERYYVENTDNGDEELEQKLIDLALIMDVEIDLDQYK